MKVTANSNQHSQRHIFSDVSTRRQIGSPCGGKFFAYTKRASLTLVLALIKIWIWSPGSAQKLPTAPQ